MVHHDNWGFNLKAILVRIGVDHSYGKWDSPADPDTMEFVYVPIPENKETKFHPKCNRKYKEILPSLKHFVVKAELDLFDDLKCPPELLKHSMHLDPDFEFLTYGDNGARRGSQIREFDKDDLIVFYAGLKPCKPCEHKLIYAIVGIFVVDEVVDAADVPRSRWIENAHTRKRKRGADDIVVRAKPGLSGRLRQFPYRPSDPEAIAAVELPSAAFQPVQQS